MTATVVIADDQPMVRAGLRSLLEGEKGVVVVGEAVDGEQALALVDRHRPDVVLMDIRMPVLDGLEATRRLVAQQSPARVLVLTTFDLDEYVFEALRAGASGFLLKDATAEELIGAVRTLAAGDAILAPAVTRRVIEAFGDVPHIDPRVAGRLDLLSAREVECCGCWRAGCPTPASPPSCTSATRRPRPTSATCSPSSVSATGCTR